MPEGDNLSRRGALTKERATLVAKLDALRQAHAAEYSESVRFGEEHQIKKTEAELADVERELEWLDGSRLYGALLRLDFGKQETLFRRFAEKFSLGSYLIHGPYEYGQRWLLNRLIKLYPLTARVVTIKVNRKTKKADIPGHWRDLAEEFGESKNSDRNQIIEAVCRCCKTQSVIIVIDDVDEMTESYLNEMHREFWKPLAAAGRTKLKDANDNRLLLVLIDHQDCVCQWNLNFPFTVEFDDAWDQVPPVKLPGLECITQSELTNWAEVMQSDLPLKIREPGAIELIYEQSQGDDPKEVGVPERVLDRICEYCEWKHGVDRWLKC